MKHIVPFIRRYEQVIEDAKRFLKLLHDFSSLGAAMRTVLTSSLVDMQSYERLTNVNEDSEYANFMRRSRELYEDALRSLPNPDPPAEFQGSKGGESSEVVSIDEVQRLQYSTSPSL